YRDSSKHTHFKSNNVLTKFSYIGVGTILNYFMFQESRYIFFAKLRFSFSFYIIYTIKFVDRLFCFIGLNNTIVIFVFITCPQNIDLSIASNDETFKAWTTRLMKKKILTCISVHGIIVILYEILQQVNFLYACDQEKDNKTQFVSNCVAILWTQTF
ncbi:hypothetical protein ACJX0J_030376, partial [Zea mays]